MQKLRYDNPGVIVIGNHINALNLIRNLGINGINTYLINDNDFCVSRFSKYIKRFIKVKNISNPRKGHTKEFLETLIQESKKLGIIGSILMPTNDYAVMLISKNKKMLEEYFLVPIPDFEVIKYTYDKRLVHEVTAKEQIPMPKTYYPHSVNDLKQFDIEYPVLIKPAIPRKFVLQGQAGVKGFVANDEKELTLGYKKAINIIDLEEILIQEIIPGGPDKVWLFGSFFKNGEALGVWTGRKIRQRPMKFGVATFAQSIYNPDIIKWGIIFLKCINYYGISVIEFREDPRDGEFKLIDPNPRTWNHHDLPTMCGVNLPLMLYKDMIDEEFQSIATFKQDLFWMHLLTDIGSTLIEVLKGEYSLEYYFKSLQKKKIKFSVLSSKDPLPFLMETILLYYLKKTR